MVDEAERCPLYQKLGWAILNSEGEWPLEVQHYEQFNYFSDWTKLLKVDLSVGW